MQIFLWIIFVLFGLGSILGCFALLGNCIDTDSPDYEGDKPISIFDGLAAAIFMLSIPFAITKLALDGIESLTFSIPWWVVVVVTVGSLIIGVLGGYKVVRNYYLLQKTLLDEKANQIELLYERRFEEITGLLKIVRSHTKEHESMIEKIIDSREKILLAKNIDSRIEAMNEQEIRFQNFCSTCDQYPELKNDRLYTKVMDSITNNESHLSGAKQYYNEQVTTYNHEVQAFPNNMLANILGCKPVELFKAQPQKVKRDIADIID